MRTRRLRTADRRDSRTRMRPYWPVIPVALASMLAPARTSAAEVEVLSSTAAQGYEVVSPWGTPALSRRRVTQTLGLSAYNLLNGESPTDEELTARVMFRLDADFGVNDHLSGGDRGGETNFGVLAGSRYVPGLEEAPIDMMYGYLEGKRLFGGWFGFRAGRQYVTDVLGWWSFDGGQVSFTTPWWVRFEAYGGFEQRGGLPLSTSRYEQQGIWRGTHADFDGGAGTPGVTDYPSYQYAQPAPAFGVALEADGPNWVHGRLTYRRVYNQGLSITQQFPDPSGGYRAVDGLRTSSERLGYQAYAPLLFHPDTLEYGALKGSLIYDFYSQIFSSATGGIEGYLGDRVTVGADVDYYEPTFDADSIWNWFSKHGQLSMTGRTNVVITKRFDVAASGGAKLWTTSGDTDTFGQGQCEAAGLPANCQEQGAYLDTSNGAAANYARDEENRAPETWVDGLGHLAARYRFALAKVEATGMVQAGKRGRRLGTTLGGETLLGGGIFSLGSRVSLFEWTDPIREDRDATSFGYVLGAGARPASFANVNVEWEHNMNRLVGQRYRVLAVLSMQVIP